VPLLAGKTMLGGKAAAYVCKNFACQAPNWAYISCIWAGEGFWPFADDGRLMPDIALFAGGKSFGGRMTSQAQAESPLQQPQLPAQRRLGDPQPDRCGADARLLGDRHEGLQQPQLHTRAGRYLGYMHAGYDR